MSVRHLQRGKASSETGICPDRVCRHRHFLAEGESPPPRRLCVRFLFGSCSGPCSLLHCAVKDIAVLRCLAQEGAVFPLVEHKYSVEKLVVACCEGRFRFRPWACRAFLAGVCNTVDCRLVHLEGKCAAAASQVVRAGGTVPRLAGAPRVGAVSSVCPPRVGAVSLVCAPRAGAVSAA